MKKNDKDQESSPNKFTRRTLAKGFAAVGVGALIPNILQPTRAAAEEYCGDHGNWWMEQPKKTQIVREVW